MTDCYSESSVGGHGPIEDAVITIRGDEIDAKQCQRCKVKVAEDDVPDGFEKNPCGWVQRVHGLEGSA